MTPTVIIAQILGMFAAILSALQHPSHVIYLWGHRKEASVLRGLSILSILFTTANSIMWGFYGAMYNAWPTALAALAAMVVMLITVWLLLQAKVWNPLAIMGYIAFCVAVSWWSVWVSQNTLGLWGNLLSIVMWIPAAIKIVKVRGTAAGLSYPPMTSWIIIATNVVWIIYGVMLQDIWLWLSSPVSILCAGLMLWAYASTTKIMSAEQTEPVLAK